mmetsp:Transcript_5472/g.16123  ORF Transcript_5472/g.16123 Transcript_5472/m.16123 type:complete len:216 (-) Transcript_5472:1592-2239(-)
MDRSGSTSILAFEPVSRSKSRRCRRARSLRVLRGWSTKAANRLRASSRADSSIMVKRSRSSLIESQSRAFFSWLSGHPISCRAVLSSTWCCWLMCVVGSAAAFFSTFIFRAGRSGSSPPAAAAASAAAAAAVAALTARSAMKFRCCCRVRMRPDEGGGSGAPGSSVSMSTRWPLPPGAAATGGGMADAAGGWLSNWFETNGWRSPSSGFSRWSGE